LKESSQLDNSKKGAKKRKQSLKNGRGETKLGVIRSKCVYQRGREHEKPRGLKTEVLKESLLRRTVLDKGKRGADRPSTNRDEVVEQDQRKKRRAAVQKQGPIVSWRVAPSLKNEAKEKNEAVGNSKKKASRTLANDAVSTKNSRAAQNEQRETLRKEQPETKKVTCWRRGHLVACANGVKRRGAGTEVKNVKGGGGGGGGGVGWWGGKKKR